MGNRAPQASLLVDFSSGNFSQISSSTPPAGAPGLVVRIPSGSNVVTQGAPGTAPWPVSVTSGTINVANLQQLSVQTILSEDNYQLSASAFSDSAAFSTDSLLDSLFLRFSTPLTRSISLTHSDGTVIWQSLANQNLNVNIDFEDLAIDAGSNIFLAVTATSASCLMDVTLTSKIGTAALGGNPVLGAGENHIGSVNLDVYDSVTGDAFNRVRVSNPQNIFDFKHSFLTGSLSFKDVGNGFTIHDYNTAAAVLSVSVTAGHKQTHISHAPIPYQPKRSQAYAATAIYGPPKHNVIRRHGMSINPALDDAIYVEQHGTSGSYFGIRTSTSGTPAALLFVSQSAWNKDTLDGSGNAANPSGFALDLSKNNLFMIDYQWLGVGRVRFGFSLNGRTIVAHEANYANLISTPFIRTPNLRAFWQIENSGTTASPSDMRAVCVAVDSEGGRVINGRKQAISTGNTALTASSTTMAPLLAIRPRMTYNGRTNHCLATLVGYDLVSDKSGRYQVLYFPTQLTGTWTNVPGNSMMEYAISPTVVGGQLFDEGFLVASNKIAVSSEDVSIERELMSLTGDDADSIAFVIQANNLEAGTANLRASFRWLEERV